MATKRNLQRLAGFTGAGDGASFVFANTHPAVDNCQEKIPAELRARNQWVACKMVPDYDKNLNLKPKPRKVPVNVYNGRGAKSNDPHTWASFDDVMGFIDEWAGVDHTHIDGEGKEVTGLVLEYPGFVFHPDDPFCGIDLDHCRNPDTGETSLNSIEIIRSFNSYTELSQSGTGFHILIKGQKPAGSGFKRGWLECYDRERYFICTGEVINGI